MSGQGPRRRNRLLPNTSPSGGDDWACVSKPDSAEHTGTLGVIKKYWDVVP